VTLAATAGELLGLSGQQLSLGARLANYVFAGPASGAAGAPTFRALARADLATAGLAITAAKTLTVQNSLTLSATDGATLAIGGGGTLGSAAYTAATAYEAAGAIATHASVVTGVHGLVNTGPYTLTIPATGTAALLGTANVFSAIQRINSQLGLNCAPDAQFDIDAAGSIRTQSYFVGKHALQIPDALLIAHFDGAEPYATDFTGNPTGHRGQVATVSGGVIYRPGKFGKAVQVAEATTNVVLDPIFGYGDLTQWTAYVSGAVRDTSRYHTGTASAKCTGDNASAFGLTRAFTTSTGGSWTASAWLYLSAYTSSYIRVAALVHYTDTTTDITFTAIDYTKLNQWQYASATQLANAGKTVDYVTFYVYSGAGVYTYYFSDCQLENKAYPTPLCAGSLGAGHTWSGTAHASTSSRTGVVLEYPSAGNVVVAAGSVMAWVVPGWSYDTVQPIATLVDLGAWFSLSYEPADDKWQFYYKTGSHLQSAAQTFTPGTAVHVAATWDAAGNAALYVNGILVDSGTGATPVLTAIKVGEQTGGYYFNGLIDDLVIVSRACSAAEIRAIYESNAPVFAETSSSGFRTPAQNAGADYFGLWALDSAGNPAFAVASIARTWGGQAMDTGDIMFGRVASGACSVFWDVSAGTWSLRNNATERMGLSSAGVLAIKNSAGNAVFTFDGSSGAEFTLPLTMASTGGIFMGTGTFASPTRALKLGQIVYDPGGANETTTLQLAGYDTAMRWRLHPILGLVMNATSGSEGLIKWYDAASNDAAQQSADISCGHSTATGDTTWTLTARATAVGDTSTILLSPMIAASAHPYILTIRSDGYMSWYSDLPAGGSFSVGPLTAGNFGCNGKTAQGSYASGGALSAYAAGNNGFDTAAHAAEVHALLVKIRAALVADGIMS
jgi:hypothetical protein